MVMLDTLKQKGIKVAIGSSSRNTPLILKQIGLSDAFDAIADGNQITHSKPDPEVFLLAGEKLGIDPAHCLVVEDADAGVEAAVAGGMTALGVGSACEHPKAKYHAKDLSVLDLDSLLDA